MDLVKPTTVKVKTPLERELARLKGYGDASLMTGDVINEFHDEADFQKELSKLPPTGRSQARQKTPILTRPPLH